MDIIQTAASDAVINIVVSLIGVFTAYATFGIYRLTEKARAEISQIKAVSARQRLENAVADIERLATITVSALEQTRAKELREAVKRGDAGSFRLSALASIASAEIMAAVSYETRRAISENFGSFDKYVTNLIEERVLALKSRGASGGRQEGVL